MRRFWVLVLILAVVIFAVAPAAAEARRGRSVTRAEATPAAVAPAAVCVISTPSIIGCGPYVVTSTCWDADGNVVSHSETWYSNPCPDETAPPPEPD